MNLKNPAAVALGKLGGLKGGPARAAALSREARHRIAQKAAQIRWGTSGTGEKKEKYAPLMLWCPFCHETKGLEMEELDDGIWAVVCNNCYTVGPQITSENEAVRKWNGEK